jgi:hypothetical protein
MGDKIKSIHGGKMKVGVPEGYQVFEKKFPKSLKNSKDYKKYDWIGNFGFQTKKSGKKVKGNMPKSYEIQVKNRSKKDLVYWNGKKTVKFKNAKVKQVGKMKVRSVKLKMGDPPIGWIN